MKCPQCDNYMRDYNNIERSGEYYNQHYCQDCKRIEITKDDTLRRSNPIRDKRIKREEERAMLIQRHEQKRKMLEMQENYVKRSKPISDQERKAYEKQREALGQRSEISAQRMAREKARYMALRQAELKSGVSSPSLRTDTDPNSDTFGQRITNRLKKPRNQGQLARIPNAVLGGLAGTMGNGKSPMITPNPNNSNPFNTPTLRQGGKSMYSTDTPTVDSDGSNDDLKNILEDKEFVKELEKSGVDTKALNVIKERLRKKLNGKIDEEKNRIPRYSEIED